MTELLRYVECIGMAIVLIIFPPLSLCRQCKECLLDKEILENLKFAVGKAKKIVSKGDGEVKAAATEFDEFVTAIMSGDDTENISPEALAEASSNNKKTSATTKAPRKGRKTRTTSQKVNEWEGDDDDDENDIADSESDGESVAKKHSQSVKAKNTSRLKRGVLKESN